MNWYILIPFGIAAIALIIFLIVRNRKDEKKFEQHLNDDYRKTKDEEDDAPTEEGLK